MMEWTPGLSTRIPQFDARHAEIFRWLAELEHAAADQRTLFGVYAVTRLKNYARELFAAEEYLLKSAGYPNLVEHIAEHAAFRIKLDEIQLRSIVQDISTDDVEFLKVWLTNHIAKTDMAYAPYLRKLNLK